MSNLDYVIVCGPPRSGTRQFADFLNAHEDVCLQAEINPKLISPIRELLKEADAVYGDSQKKNIYEKKRADAVSAMFSFFSKGNIFEKPDCRVQGFKLPHAELHSGNLNEIITPSFQRLNYFYCIRNLKDTYLSLMAMPWFRASPDQFFKKYVKSLKAAIQMDGKANGGAVINVVSLDGFLESRDRGEWLLRNLFLPIGIQPNSKTLNEYIDNSINKNSSSRKNLTKPNEFDEDAISDYFKNKKEILEWTASFNRAFGTNLNNDFG